MAAEDEKPKMCSLLKAVCTEDGCAWWSTLNEGYEKCAIQGIDVGIDAVLSIMSGYEELPIMTPWNIRWHEFCTRLVGNNPTDDNGLRCGGEFLLDDGTINDNSYAVPILIDMGFDVRGSIDFFQENGAFCDCEILLNVMPDERYDPERCARYMEAAKSRKRSDMMDQQMR